jgi:hypothetical protein
MKKLLLSIVALTVLSSLSWGDCQKPCVVARYRVTTGTRLKNLTLYTPPTDGMFRMSVYFDATNFTRFGTGVGNACLTIIWSDDSVVRRYFPIHGDQNCIEIGEKRRGLGAIHPVMAFFSKAGTPIVFSVKFPGPRPPQGAEYTLSLVLEQIDD